MVVNTSDISPLECFLRLRNASQLGDTNATELVHKWSELKRSRGFEFVEDEDHAGSFQRTIVFSEYLLLYFFVPFIFVVTGNTGAALTTLVYRKKR